MAEHTLRTELETYHREKDGLLPTSEGKYALIRGDSVIGVWDTYQDALKAGYGQFGLSPFLVKQIQRLEQVHHFSRDLVACQS